MMAMVTRRRGKPRPSDKEVGGEGRNKESFVETVDTHPAEGPGVMLATGYRADVTVSEVEQATGI